MENPMIRVFHNFITEEEEAAILAKVPPVVNRNNGALRRNVRYKIYRTDDMIKTLEDRIMEETPMPRSKQVIPFVLMNEYLPGGGYGMHQDAPGGKTAILNLLSDATLAFCGKQYTDEPNDSMEKFLLPRRALIYFDGDDYYKRSHGVFPVQSLRYSLFFWRK